MEIVIETLILRTAEYYDSLKKEIVEFLKNENLYQDVGIKTYAEWNDSIGNDSFLTITFEGPLYHIINYPNKRTPVIENGLNEIFGKYGFYFELGYAWTMHLYPKDEEYRNIWHNMRLIIEKEKQ